MIYKIWQNMGVIMNVNKIKQALSKSLENKIDISNRNVLVFGAGNTSFLYQFCFDYENIDIKAFIDNDPSKKGKHCLGKKILSFDEVNNYDNPVILISTTNENTLKEIKELLVKNNFECFVVDEYVFTKNSDKVMEVFDLFDDYKSREVYADMILARMGKKSMNLDLISSNQYFGINEFTKRRNDEIFVDCGAYVGDTIEDYIKIKEGVFGKLYAFEPDIRNFNAMKCRIDRLNKEWPLSDDKINLINAGVGQNTSKMFLNNQISDLCSTSSLGTSFSNEVSDNGIDVYALDDYFSDAKVSFIKADIESFEEKMIKGAEYIIKRDKPLMAVCVYHSPSDMYRIPLLLNKINPDYKFSLRQHKGELCETVLYAY